MHRYQNNAFRILGLPPSVSISDIASRANEIKVKISLGAPVAYDYDFPWMGTLDRSEENIIHTLQRLENPNLRIREEMFWFWVENDTDKKALSYLNHNKRQPAHELWEQSRTSSIPIIELFRDKSPKLNAKNISSYVNQAILAHSSVISEELSHFKDKNNVIPESHWKKWHFILERFLLLNSSDTFWNEVSKRAGRINDPRLSEARITELKNSFPAEVVETNLFFITKALSANQYEIAKRHSRLLDEISFPKDILRKGFNKILSYQSDSVNKLTQSVSRKFFYLKKENGISEEKLINLYSFLMHNLDNIIVQGNTVDINNISNFAIAKDNLAQVIREIAVALNNLHTGMTYEKSYELMNQAIEYATSDYLKQKFKKDEEIIKSNLDRYRRDSGKVKISESSDEVSYEDEEEQEKKVGAEEPDLFCNKARKQAECLSCELYTGGKGIEGDCLIDEDVNSPIPCPILKTKDTQERNEWLCPHCKFYEKKIVEHTYWYKENIDCNKGEETSICGFCPSFDRVQNKKYKLGESELIDEDDISQGQGDLFSSKARKRVDCPQCELYTGSETTEGNCLLGEDVDSLLSCSIFEKREQAPRPDWLCPYCVYYQQEDARFESECELNEDMFLCDYCDSFERDVDKILEERGESLVVEQRAHVASNQVEEKEMLNAAIYRANLQRTGFYSTKGLSSLHGIIWSYKISQDFPEETKGISATPIISDKVIYFGAEDGNLYAVDIQTGAQKWKFNTGASIGSAPALNGDIVYVSGEKLYAVNKSTAKEIWRKPYAFRGTGGSPALINGLTLLGSLIDDSHAFLALEARTGEVAWQYEIGRMAVYCSPAINNGVVYFGRQGFENSQFFAFDLKNGHEKWKFPIPGIQSGATVVAAPIVTNDAVYFKSRNGKLYALDIVNGRERWSIQRGFSDNSAMVFRNNMIYICGVSLEDPEVKGALYAINAINGSEIWKFNINEGSFNQNLFSPIATEGIIYCAGGNAVFAIDMKAGRKIWQFDHTSKINSITIEDGVLYFASEDGGIYALS